MSLQSFLTSDLVDFLFLSKIILMPRIENAISPRGRHGGVLNVQRIGCSRPGLAGWNDIKLFENKTRSLSPGFVPPGITERVLGTEGLLCRKVLFSGEVFPS